MKRIMLLAGTAFLYTGMVSAAGLAEHHIKQAGADCQSCHSQPIEVKDNEARENQACISCHGSLQELLSRQSNRFRPTTVILLTCPAPVATQATRSL